jgi:Outer membrane protein beta-barrel domain
MTRHLRKHSLVPILALAGLLAASSPAPAGDLTVFIARPSPNEIWDTGFGAALGASLLGVISLEGEAARLTGEAADASMTSFTLAGLLSPPVGRLIPYGGVGAGFYRQSLVDDSQNEFFTAFILGVKLELGNAFVVKGEYRIMELPDQALIPLDNRLSLGMGIKF